MAEPVTIVVLEGDQTGQELLEEAVRLLSPELLAFAIELEAFDLSPRTGAKPQTKWSQRPPPRCARRGSG
jgi:isocitrate/isopropylmalate dehydrogenase